MNHQPKILFSCGDISADKYLSELLKSIKSINSQIETYVLGGELSKPFCDNFVEDMVGYEAHVLPKFSVIKKFFTLLKKIDIILQQEIKLVVLIDYYGFNIKIAKLAKKYNIPVIYYITPQIWASRKYRIKNIKKYVDKVINIYPFETEIYNKHGIKSVYFGHPMMDSFVNTNKRQLTINKNMIGLFPGSRAQVIKWNLPPMLEIIKYYTKNYNNETQFVIFGFEKYKDLYKTIVARQQLSITNLEICYNNEYKDKISFAVSVSGTVVLENVLNEIPSLVLYKLPLSTYLIAKTVLITKYISLPNIILNKEVVPEFLQNSIDIKKMCEYINFINTSETKYKELINEYKEIKNILKNNNNETVSKTVAKEIIKYLYESN